MLLYSYGFVKIMKTEIESFLEFAKHIEKLKNIERFKGHFYWKDYPQLERYESVADHSWRVAMLVLLFQDKLSQKIDITKAIKMALLHDLAEIIAGDASPLGEDGTGKNSHAFNSQKAAERHEEELNAAQKLFSLLPAKISKDLFDTWMEFEQQEKFEARFVKSLDRMEAMLQVLSYRQGHVFPEHLDFNIKYGLKGADVDPALTAFGQIIAQEMKTKFRPFGK